MESIERGESKPTMLTAAFELGLTVPAFTINGESPSSVSDVTVYKKVIGPPFVISFSKASGQEVGVTTTNVPVDTKSFLADSSFWQWQELIQSVAQIRCFVVGDRIWASIIANTKSGEDFRFRNEVERENMSWSPYVLPSHISERIFLLMNKIGISVASPEFVMNEKGELIFIDLNPCGDWLGFFNESTNSEIVSELVNFLKSV